MDRLDFSMVPSPEAIQRIIDAKAEKVGTAR
jgi:hypothetical protein